MEEFRTIVTSYLVMTEKGPFAMGDKKDSTKWQKLAKEKGLNPRVIKITTHTNRMAEIGKHLFKVKIPSNNLVSFRNSMIQEMRNLCDVLNVDYDNINKNILWKKVASKYDLDNMDFDEFHRCVMNKLEYVNGC